LSVMGPNKYSNWF